MMRSGNPFGYLVKLAQEKRWGSISLFVVAVTAPLIVGCILEASSLGSFNSGEWVGGGGLASFAVLAAGSLMFGRRPADLLLAAGSWAALVVALAVLWPTAVASPNLAIKIVALVLLAAAYLVWVPYWWRKSQAPGGDVPTPYVTSTAAFLVVFAAWHISDAVVLGGTGGEMALVQTGRFSGPVWLYPMVIGVLELGLAAARVQPAPATRGAPPVLRESQPRKQAAAPDVSDQVARRVVHIFGALIGVGVVVSSSAIVAGDWGQVVSNIGLAILIAGFAELLLGLGIVAYLSHRGRTRRDH